MASKLVSVSKIHKILFPTPRLQTISRSSYSSSNNHEAQEDESMTQGVDTQGETYDPKPDQKDNITPTKEDDHYIRPKTQPSNISSSKLQTPGVNTPIDPHVQQRRTLATKPNNDLTFARRRRTLATKSNNDLASAACRRTLATTSEDDLTCTVQRRTLATKPSNDLTCAGLDGTPWPEEESASREEQEEDDKEYFKEHKASPLSNMEMGDTRKPLEKVVQATADGYFGGEKVMTWLPEQLDTAEESLLRALRMFREAAAKGVPESPHSRRLRELRGEDW